MLDTRTNQWLSRLQGNGPAYVSLILAALIAIELARMAISILGGPVKTPQPVVNRPAAPHVRPGVDVQKVVSAHLFGIAAIEPGAQEPADGARPQARRRRPPDRRGRRQHPAAGPAGSGDFGPSHAHRRVLRQCRR